jgi:hypothetical protein
MGIFSRTKAAPPAFVAEPIKAAVGMSYNGIGDYFSWTGSWKRDQAIQIPTISRARDLIVSLISGLPIEQYSLMWDEAAGEYEEMMLPAEPWMSRPDPKVTRQFILAWTADDLLFFGRAHWLVTSRSSITGLPLTFQWIPAADVSLPNMPGPQYWTAPTEIEFNGIPLDPREVITFLSPIQSWLTMGNRAIEISNRLDNAAMRFASNEITAGYLQQTPNSEPMDGEELSELVAAWAAARQRNAIGALNASVTWHEFDSDPSKLQLVEARKHQMTELANLCNVPQVLVGADAGTGMTYTNVQESQRALYLSAKQYIECISQTLSMNNVLAPGHLCRLNVSEYLHESPSMSSDDSSAATEATEIANVVQKIYLGVVNGLLTVDEARKIINEAGADLPESMPS